MNSSRLQRSTNVLLLVGALLFTGCEKKRKAVDIGINRDGEVTAPGIELEGAKETEMLEVVDTPPSEQVPEEDGWTNLLDAGLNQWTQYLTRSKEAEGIAVSDVFSVERREGELVLDISGKCPAALMSVEEFENYHLTLEYKWGDDASDKQKASGLTYHSVGKPGRVVRTWMTGVEFDISEESTGGLYAIAGITTNVASEQIDKKSSRYVPGAPVHQIAQSFAPGVSFRTIEQIRPFRCLPLEGGRGDQSGWVRIDLYVVGNTAQHYVDGELVLELQDAGLQYLGESRKELVKGKLQLQAESSGISFRKIRIADIDALPDA